MVVELNCLVAGAEDDVPARLRRERPHGLSHPPPRPIANDGVAEASADDEGRPRYWHPCLEDPDGENIISEHTTVLIHGRDISSLPQPLRSSHLIAERTAGSG